MIPFDTYYYILNIVYKPICNQGTPHSAIQDARPPRTMEPQAPPVPCRFLHLRNLRWKDGNFKYKPCEYSYTADFFGIFAGNMYIYIYNYVKLIKIARKFHQKSWCLVMFLAKHCATVGGAYPAFSTCSKVLVDERGLQTRAKAVHQTTINSARNCPAKCSLEAIFVSV